MLRRSPIFALATFCAGACAQTQLMQAPLGDTPKPNMSLSFLNVKAGATIPTHSHAGAVFAYVLQGDIENQVDPEPAKIYHPGDFFHEHPMQVHRLLRNLSESEPAKILIFQNTGTLPTSVHPLLQETLANTSNQQVSVFLLAVAPNATVPQEHQYRGLVFAYVVRGEIESEVDQAASRTYRAGEAFFEPPIHGQWRNPGKTETAELVIFEVAASAEAAPVWETLMRAPLPADAEPKVSVVSIPVPPASPGPRTNGAGHTHAGPVFAYLLQGEIENQVEPDPPQIYQPGGFFYEAPMHIHKFLHNRSATEPAKLIVFEAGAMGQAVPAIKTLFEEPLSTTVNQKLSLLRLTLPPGGVSESRAHSGPAIVYVLEGKIGFAGTTDQPQIHDTGDLFAEPAGGGGFRFTNASRTEPAKILLYRVNESE